MVNRLKGLAGEVKLFKKPSKVSALAVGILIS